MMKVFQYQQYIISSTRAYEHTDALPMTHLGLLCANVWKIL